MRSKAQGEAWLSGATDGQCKYLLMLQAENPERAPRRKERVYVLGWVLEASGRPWARRVEGQGAYGWQG